MSLYENLPGSAGTITGVRRPHDPRPGPGRPAREIARRVRAAQRDLLGH